MDFALTAFASVLFIVDPLGTVPAFLVLTEGLTPPARRRIALVASVVATLVLAGFALIGSRLFQLLGLSMPAFQIAGGLILFLVALDMIRAKRSTQEDPGEVAEGKETHDVAITPLAIPMLAGPAGLSTVATLVSRADGLVERLSVYAAIAVTGVVSYLTLALAGPVQARLGRTGIHVLSRIFGLILAGIAVQFVLDGLRAAGFPVHPPPG